MFSRLRLGTQVWLVVVLLLAAASGGLTWYSGQVRKGTLSTATKQRLEMKQDSLAAKAALLAKNAALASTRAALMMDYEFLQGVMAATVQGDKTVVYGYIANADDEVIVHSDKTQVGKKIEGAGRAPKDSAALNVKNVGNDVLEAVAPVLINDEVWGAVHYGVSYAPVRREAASAKAELKTALRRGHLFSIGLALGLLLLCMLATVAAAERLVRPLRTLEGTVQRVLAKNADVKVEVPAVRELGQLANGFNVLLSRLHEREQRLRAELLQAELAAQAKGAAPADAGTPSIIAATATSAASAALPASGRSLRTQLLALMLGLTVASVLVLGGLLFYRLHRDLNRSLAKMSEQIRADLADKGVAVTRNAALAVSQAAEVKEFFFLVQLVQSTLTADSEIVTGFIEDPQGRVLVHSDPQKAGVTNTVPEHSRAMQQRKPESRTLTQDGAPVLEVTAPIEVGGSAWGTLSFGLSHERLEKTLAEVKTTQAALVEKALSATAVGFAVLVLVAALAAWLASRFIVGPLGRLRRDLDKICAGDRKLRVQIHSCREFTTLSMSINELTASAAERDQQIAQRIEQAKRQVAGA
ncbi:MAG: HAMP domain-containing protein [Deltaproteobacteria bacterium]|nr:HAMP domain-containing protein [Deltaproteobacteria bacterium]